MITKQMLQELLAEYKQVTPLWSERQLTERRMHRGLCCKMQMCEELSNMLVEHGFLKKVGDYVFPTIYHISSSFLPQIGQEGYDTCIAPRIKVLKYLIQKYEKNNNQKA